MSFRPRTSDIYFADFGCKGVISRGGSAGGDVGVGIVHREDQGQRTFKESHDLEEV